MDLARRGEAARAAGGRQGACHTPPAWYDRFGLDRPCEPVCSAIIGSLCRKRVGVQATRMERGAKQHWTRDVRAGIIARDNNSYLRGTPWR
jgi:hypothetical protein